MQENQVNLGIYRQFETAAFLVTSQQIRLSQNAPTQNIKLIKHKHKGKD